MKTLKNHTLIYDKDCPMCCAYTSAFIKTGVLDKEGREPFKPALFPANPKFNAHRAQNEIALLNRKTGEVQYGIESMFTVIGHAAPILKPLFKFKPFMWLMKKVYSFISYNRKVIAPPAANPAEINCVPDVNLKYRWLYITLAVLMAGFISVFGLKLEETKHFGYFSDMSMELGVMGIIVMRLLLQAAVVKLHKQGHRLLDYLGNLVTVNLQLAFIVGLGFVAAHFKLLEEILPITLIGFGSIYAIIIHTRRLKSLGMNPWLCLEWNLQWLLIIGLTALAWN